MVGRKERESISDGVWVYPCIVCEIFNEQA